MNEKWVAAIFKKFQARYGHKWAGAIEGIEAVAVAEWLDGLRDLGPQDISRGLKVWQGDWPPSLPEFRRACLGELLPETNEEWAALGESRGVYALPGESWRSYIRRIQIDERRRVCEPGALRLTN